VLSDKANFRRQIKTGIRIEAVVLLLPFITACFFLLESTDNTESYKTEQGKSASLRITLCRYSVGYLTYENV
jgi:hypothetical protein